MARGMDQNWEKRTEKRKEKHGRMRNRSSINAGRLRGIYFIDPEDKEHKETIKNARRKLETPTEVAGHEHSSTDRALDPMPIFSFLFSGRISQIGSILLATRDLGWQSPVFLSVSLRTTYILREAFLAIE